MYTLSHNMNMYPFTLEGECTAGWCTSQTHTSHSEPSLWQRCQQESSLFSFCSLCFTMPVSVHSVAMSPELFLFSLYAGLLYFIVLSFYTIMKLKSFVPEGIRRESDKVRGTLAEMFSRVMSSSLLSAGRRASNDDVCTPPRRNRVSTVHTQKSRAFGATFNSIQLCRWACSVLEPVVTLMMTWVNTPHTPHCKPLIAYIAPARKLIVFAIKEESAVTPQTET